MREGWISAVEPGHDGAQGAGGRRRLPAANRIEEAGGGGRLDDNHPRTAGAVAVPVILHHRGRPGADSGVEHHDIDLGVIGAVRRGLEFARHGPVARGDQLGNFVVVGGRGVLNDDPSVRPACLQRELHRGIVALINEHDLGAFVLYRVDARPYRMRRHEYHGAKPELPRHPRHRAPMIAVSGGGEHRVRRRIVRREPMVHGERSTQDLECIEAESMGFVLDGEGCHLQLGGQPRQPPQRRGRVAPQSLMVCP